jgi:hypothetical protein
MKYGQFYKIVSIIIRILLFVYPIHETTNLIAELKLLAIDWLLFFISISTFYVLVIGFLHLWYKIRIKITFSVKNFIFAPLSSAISKYLINFYSLTIHHGSINYVEFIIQATILSTVFYSAKKLRYVLNESDNYSESTYSIIQNIMLVVVTFVYPFHYRVINFLLILSSVKIILDMQQK